MNGERWGSLKDFQNQVESLHAGDKIKVAVLRNGKDECIRNWKFFGDGWRQVAAGL